MNILTYKPNGGIGLFIWVAGLALTVACLVLVILIVAMLALGAPVWAFLFTATLLLFAVYGLYRL